jgi:hypothetical protein
MDVEQNFDLTAVIGLHQVFLGCTRSRKRKLEVAVLTERNVGGRGEDDGGGELPPDREPGMDTVLTDKGRH